MIQELANERNWPVQSLCRILEVSRAGYYKWLNRVPSSSEIENRFLLEEITKIHHQVKKIYGYRRMTLQVNKNLGTKYNQKRIRRIMRIRGYFSKIRRPRPSWQRSNPFHLSENILNREFDAATAPNQIWCTDVTEFKYGQRKKLFLSAIIDLYDKSIVSYQLSDFNDNPIVLNTIESAFEEQPQANPLIHSDRGFQYTSIGYKRLKERYQFKTSMSRVSKCLDNQPIESFWGVLKSECFYLGSYSDKDSLAKDIKDYIHFYNNKRVVIKYDGLTPLEYRYQTIT